MTARLKAPNASALVAIKLDGSCHYLLREAEGLCAQTGLALRVVHVCESVVLAMPPVEFADLMSSEEIARVEEDNVRRSSLRLEALMKSFKPRTSRLSYRTLVGNPTDAILQEATDTDASIILTGSARTDYSLVPKGFSTALSLMADSKIPVIVIPDGRTASFDQTEFRLLLADDLEHHSEEPALLAVDLASLLKKTILRHVFVHDLTREKIMGALKGLQPFMVGEQDHAELATVMLAKYEERLRLTMRERARWVNILTEQGGTYEPKLLTGKIPEELVNAGREFQPNIIVFGQHHKVHRRPFMLGQLPFRTMISMGLPIIAVPDQCR